ncbi:restriction endonuclease subunit S [bacterium]|nr:restriction endonuclease subunit S [bacterium]
MQSDQTQIDRLIPEQLGEDTGGVSACDQGRSAKSAPGSWSEVSLLDVVPRAEYGISVPLDGQPEGVPVLRMGNLTGGTVDLSDLKYSRSPEAKAALLQDRDVLFNRTNSFDHVGRTSIWHSELPEASFASYLVRLIPDPEMVTPEFLTLWFNLAATQIAIRRYATPGVHQVNINPTNLRRVMIYLPDTLPPQRKIARILSTVDDLIEQTEALVAKQQAIKQGMMHDLLTRGVDDDGHLRPSFYEAPELYRETELGWLPASWEPRLLGQLVSPQRPIAYGILMPGYGHPGGVPVIKVKDIREGQIQTDDLLLTSPEIDEAYKRSRVREGDLLFSIRGTVGRMAIVPQHLSDANITQDTARIGLVEGDARFISAYLGMPAPASFIASHTLGVAVQGINLGDVRLIPVAFPLPDEQTAIGDILDAQEAAVVAEQRQLAKLRLLKGGLMHDLLTGEVPVTPDEGDNDV